MLMSIVWLLLTAGAILFGASCGRLEAVSTAAIEGAGAAIELCIGICGAVCLWSGVMEIMSQSGASAALARLLSPLLKRLFPKSFRDRECAEALSENFSSNLLGLGNAATPAGIRAAKRMLALQGNGETGSELCRLVVLNSASLQLIPSTVAAVRAKIGAASPFDILPCVLLTSLCSVTVGLTAARLFERRHK